MKTSHFFYFLLAVILFSCNEQNSNEQFADYGYEDEGYGFENEEYGYYENGSEDVAMKTTQSQNNDSQNNGYQQNTNNQQIQQNNRNTSNGGRIQMYQIMNKQFGMPVGGMPLPSTWKRSNNTKENVFFEGPGNVKVYNDVTNSFFYSNNAQRNQIAQQQGTQVKPVKSLDRFITEDFKPMAEQQGARFMRQYPLPQLAKFDKQLDSYLFKATPENKQYQCMVTEWSDKDGKKSIVIFRYFVTQYTAIGGMEWGYRISGMDASSGAYEEAKNSFINSIMNFQINPQWVQAHNQHYQRMAQQQSAGHASRMAQIKSFGEANTRRHNSRMAASDARHSAYMSGQAASDARHSTYMNGQASSDRGQAAYVDGIWERQNMTDNNGTQYKVDGYDNNVWKNQNNETIGTDNTNWNPNIDNSTNGDNWEQLQTTDDGGW